MWQPREWLPDRKRRDAIANNLANLNTTGFKADRPAFATVYERQLYRVEGTRAQPIGALSAGAILRELYTDSQQGALTTTGNPLDAAIDGAGFFAVQTAQGVRYTRNGAFQLDASGTLTTRAGNPVLGENNQPIRVPPNATVQIGEDGSVLANGTRVARLLIVQGDLAKAPTATSSARRSPSPTRASSQAHWRPRMSAWCARWSR
jgi:flagellar basal-body rod protein FlgF